MSGLGEQIAVLDGLAALDPNDGRIGQEQARVDQYGRPIMPGVLARRNVIDPSEGANYTGGSSSAPMVPLMPSSVGLAGLGQNIPPQVYAGAAAPFVAPYLRRLPGMGNIPGVLPTRQHVIDYSGGAQYSGGSSWVPGLPLTPSSAGLADSFIKGGYGRAGLGAPFIQGGYGRAGLGQTAAYVDEDLASAMEAVETERQLDPGDGRIGQRRAQVDEYGKPIMPGVLARSNVLDASEGANYSGGSSAAPGLPLMPSSIGLAGLDGALAELQAQDDTDSTEMPMPAKLRAVASRRKVAALKNEAKRVAKRMQRTTSAKKRAKDAQKINVLGQKLARARQIRRAVAQRGGAYAVRRPMWAQ